MSHTYFETLDQVHGNLLSALAAEVSYGHVRVEFGQAGNRHLSARLPDVFLSQEELVDFSKQSGQTSRIGSYLTAKVRYFHWLRIVDGYRLDTSKDHILG